MITELELTGDHLYERVNELLQKPELRKQMADAAGAAAFPNATQEIARAFLQLAASDTEEGE